MMPNTEPMLPPGVHIPEEVLQRLEATRAAARDDDRELREEEARDSADESEESEDHTGPDSRQVNVFEEVAAPVVKGVLDGYNGTIFAYG